MEVILILLMVLILVVLAASAFGMYSLMRHTDRMQQDLELMQRDRAVSSADLQNSQKQTLDYLKDLFQGVEKLKTANAQSIGTVTAMSRQVQSMNDVMVNAKKRGSWGEYQLEQIVRTYLGDSDRLYDTQVTLGNGRIADGVFHLPGTEKIMCIDSKFPMENYLAMSGDPDDSAYYEKELKKNIRKHINDVADKYIVSGETTDEAMLFIPSEAIYEYICSEGRDLMELAMSRHIMMVSPTTLCGVLFTLQASSREFYRAENLEQIEKNLRIMEEDIRRMKERADKLNTQASKLCDTSRDVQISAEKIESRFARMMEGKE